MPEARQVILDGVAGHKFNLPVCKALDCGKFTYEAHKKANAVVR